MPSHALVLHPDAATRDPFGVRSVAQVYEYRLWAEGFMEGWYEAACWSDVPPLTYATLREALLGLTDMPYETACQVALWLTRDSAQQYWLSFTVVL